MMVATNTDDRELSLEAMWHAYRASKFPCQYRIEIDTGVVHALLNARYYSPTQGQFISQDPVFWEIGLTRDGVNALSNPQALNSYGYANGNPIVFKDPQGRFIPPPLLVPLALFAIGPVQFGLHLGPGDG
jgi:RHS repeat-associated protein